MKNKSISARLSAFAAVLALAVSAFFLIYGIVNNYFDGVVLLAELVSAVLFALYAFQDKAWSEYMNLAGVTLMSFGLGLFFLNSYTVWADWYGNFDMYGSRGGVAPVIIQLVLLLCVIVLGTISCFKSKGGKTA